MRQTDREGDTEKEIKIEKVRVRKKQITWIKASKVKFKKKYGGKLDLVSSISEKRKIISSENILLFKIKLHKVQILWAGVGNMK